MTSHRVAEDWEQQVTKHVKNSANGQCRQNARQLGACKLRLDLSRKVSDRRMQGNLKPRHSDPVHALGDNEAKVKDYKMHGSNTVRRCN